ncbi:MAG: bifunctional UDP-N-acetylglucosamine diphosphorylase/glucosamine-1-phosphate N-acetyltransferase GlmU [Terriglobales bacterium]
MPTNHKPAEIPRFAIAILAAGKGTRLKSRLPKVLHAIAGKPLLRYVIDAAAQVVPPHDIFAIIGHEAERVQQSVKSSGVNFVLQAEQRGTGHAIMTARQALVNYDFFLVLSGDVPLIRPETIQRVRDFHLQHGAAMTILTAQPHDPTGYGRIIREKRRGKASEVVARIVEQKALAPKELGIREINSGIYAFSSRPVFAHLDKLTTDNAHQEFYLTDMAAILSRAGERVVAVPAGDSSEVLGVNTRLELARLDFLLRQRKCEELMAAGVTIFRPETCLIDAQVQVGADSVIQPFVQLRGKTRIGEECQVDSYSIITDCELGNRVTVRPGCILTEARVADAAILGPYSHLRPGAEIGSSAHVGNFVEIKKSRLGKSSKANHLAYLGDATVGDNVNVGAGTITCNYDGVKKHPTIIEDGAFIGSDSILVAPVKIGRDAYVAAASCITEDVPADALALGRARQTNKEGWAKQKREQQHASNKQQATGNK